MRASSIRATPKAGAAGSTPKTAPFTVKMRAGRLSGIKTLATHDNFQCPPRAPTNDGGKIVEWLKKTGDPSCPR